MASPNGCPNWEPNFNCDLWLPLVAVAAFVAMNLLHATFTVLINYEYLCAVRSRDGRATHKVIKLAQKSVRFAALGVSAIRDRLVNNVYACVLIECLHKRAGNNWKFMLWTYMGNRLDT